MNSFDVNGYKQIVNLIDSQTIKTISQYFENKICRGEWLEKTGDHKDSSRLGYYADPLIEVMLKQCQSAIEENTGLLLEPTYSYSRVYQGGEDLKPHTDRPSCEISVTVNVACTGSEPWPIWMQYEEKDPVKCMLNPGDAVVYKGCEVTHWRRKLPEGQINAQFMLHYVIKDGPNGEYKFDKRPTISAPETTRGI
jgi:hypothetical protein